MDTENENLFDFVYYVIPVEFKKDMKNMSAYAHSVYNIMMSCTNYKRDNDFICWASYKSIKDVCGFSEDSIAKGIKELINRGWIRDIKKGKNFNNIYYLNIIPEINHNLVAYMDATVKRKSDVSKKSKQPTRPQRQGVSAHSGYNYINNNYIKLKNSNIQNFTDDALSSVMLLNVENPVFDSYPDSVKRTLALFLKTFDVPLENIPIKPEYGQKGGQYATWVKYLKIIQNMLEGYDESYIFEKAKIIRGDMSIYAPHSAKTLLSNAAMQYNMDIQERLSYLQ